MVFKRMFFNAGAGMAAMAAELFKSEVKEVEGIALRESPEIKGNHHNPRRHGRYKGYYSDTPERREFIDAHDKNPLNFLPGAVLHGLYQGKKSQRQMEREGHEALQRLIARGYQPKPGYRGKPEPVKAWPFDNSRISA